MTFSPPSWLIAAFAAALFSCGASSVGKPCTVNADCDNGQTCLTTAPGGYCTRGCSAAGSTQDCPGGTVCANHATTLQCSAVCSDQGGCRENYACVGVASTTDKACVPK